MQEKIKNNLLIIITISLCIGGIIAIPLSFLSIIGWFLFNNINMDYSAWILIIILALGILNYVGFRR